MQRLTPSNHSKKLIQTTPWILPTLIRQRAQELGLNNPYATKHTFILPSGENREIPGHYSPKNVFAQQVLAHLSIGNYLPMFAHYDTTGKYPHYDLIVDLSQTKFDDHFPITADTNHIRIALSDTGDNFNYLLKQLSEQAVFKRINEMRANGKNILINCTCGVSRSATVTLLYLMQTYQVSLVQAYHYLLSQRPVISPNPGYIAALLNYESSLQVEPISLEQALPWLKDYIKSTALDSFKIKIQDQDDEVLFSNMSNEGFINLISFLKIFNIPFKTVNCDKFAGDIQLSQNAYSQFKQIFTEEKQKLDQSVISDSESTIIKLHNKLGELNNNSKANDQGNTSSSDEVLSVFEILRNKILPLLNLNEVTHTIDFKKIANALDITAMRKQLDYTDEYGMTVLHIRYFGYNIYDLVLAATKSVLSGKHIAPERSLISVPNIMKVYLGKEIMLADTVATALAATVTALILKRNQSTRGKKHNDYFDEAKQLIEHPTKELLVPFKQNLSKSLLQIIIDEINSAIVQDPAICEFGLELLKLIKSNRSDDAIFSFEKRNIVLKNFQCDPEWLGLMPTPPVTLEPNVDLNQSAIVLYADKLFFYDGDTCGSTEIPRTEKNYDELKTRLSEIKQYSEEPCDVLVDDIESQLISYLSTALSAHKDEVSSLGIYARSQLAKSTLINQFIANEMTWIKAILKPVHEQYDEITQFKLNDNDNAEAQIIAIKTQLDKINELKTNTININSQIEARQQQHGRASIRELIKDYSELTEMPACNEKDKLDTSYINKSLPNCIILESGIIYPLDILNKQFVEQRYRNDEDTILQIEFQYLEQYNKLNEIVDATAIDTVTQKNTVTVPENNVVIENEPTATATPTPTQLVATLSPVTTVPNEKTENKLTEVSNHAIESTPLIKHKPTFYNLYACDTAFAIATLGVYAYVKECVSQESKLTTPAMIGRIVLTLFVPSVAMIFNGIFNLFKHPTDTQNIINQDVSSTEKLSNKLG